jgi:hypothetical protein
LDGPYLRRVDEPQAILQLIESMGRTPAGSWAGAPSFGVRDLFQGMRTRQDGLRDAVRAINTTLNDLGIDRYRLDSIDREPGTSPDADSYVLNLVDASDPRRTYSRTIGK